MSHVHTLFGTYCLYSQEYEQVRKIYVVYADQICEHRAYNSLHSLCYHCFVPFLETVKIHECA